MANYVHTQSQWVHKRLRSLLFWNHTINFKSQFCDSPRKQCTFRYSYLLYTLNKLSVWNSHVLYQICRPFPAFQARKVLWKVRKVNLLPTCNAATLWHPEETNPLNIYFYSSCKTIFSCAAVKCLGLGIDQIPLKPMPLSILLVDPIHYQLPYQCWTFFLWGSRMPLSLNPALVSQCLHAANSNTNVGGCYCFSSTNSLRFLCMGTGRDWRKTNKVSKLLPFLF